MSKILTGETIVDRLRQNQSQRQPGNNPPATPSSAAADVEAAIVRIAEPDAKLDDLKGHLEHLLSELTNLNQTLRDELTGRREAAGSASVAEPSQPVAEPAPFAYVPSVAFQEPELALAGGPVGPATRSASGLAVFWMMLLLFVAAEGAPNPFSSQVGQSIPLVERRAKLREEAPALRREASAPRPAWAHAHDPARAMTRID
jgi:hypothetical protein